MHIPNSVKALEISEVTKTEESTNNTDQEQKRFLDLRLCIEIPGEIDKNRLEKALYTEISRTLKGIINRNAEERDNPDPEADNTAQE